MFFVVLLLLLSVPFGIAMEIERAEFVKEYPSFKDEVHEKFLNAVVRHEYRKVVVYLEDKLVDINKQDCPNNYNALQIAAAFDDTMMVDLLLKFGADIDSPNNKSGHTPLIYAAWHAQYATLEHLLKKGADVNKQNNDGETALYFPIDFKKLDKVKLLLRYHADPKITNKKGVTPLQRARENDAKWPDADGKEIVQALQDVVDAR
jgi:ankyrin repeat protein